MSSRRASCTGLGRTGLGRTGLGRTGLGRTGLKSYFVAALLLSTPFSVQAAGYALFPSVSGIARLLAGNGLLEQEASGLIYNAASPALQSEQAQLEAGLSFIAHEVSMQNQGSQFTRVINGTAVNSNIAGVDGTARSTAVIPSLFYTTHFSALPKLSMGVALSAPYGLDGEYNKNWVGRYQALRSSLEIMELDLVLAWQLNAHWMLGAGISVQKADVELTQAAPVSPVQDALLSIAGSSNQQGFTAGLVYLPNAQLKLGLNFRSRVSHDFDSIQKLVLADTLLSETAVQAPLVVPETLMLSLHYTPLDVRWSVAAAVRHTRWERFDELALNYPDGSSKNYAQLWENSISYSVSIDYQVKEQQKIIFSLASEQGPVPNAMMRNARIPDADRKIIGVGYEINEAFCRTCSVLMAYHRTMTEASYINRTEAFQPGFSNQLNGKYASSAADVLGVSLTMGFK